MKPPQATIWVADPRFAPYLTETEGDHQRACGSCTCGTPGCRPRRCQTVRLTQRSCCATRSTPDSPPVNHGDDYSKTLAHDPASVDDMPCSGRSVPLGGYTRPGAAPSQGWRSREPIVRLLASIVRQSLPPFVDEPSPARRSPCGSGNRHQVAGLTSRLLQRLVTGSRITRAIDQPAGAGSLRRPAGARRRGVRVPTRGRLDAPDYVPRSATS